MIEIRNVSKVIKGATVLRDVSISMEGGKIYGLKGPNGSGKTMLMRLVAGLIRPTDGEVCINGYLLGRDFDFPPSLGMLIENPAFLPNYSGCKNLELLAQIKGIAGNNAIRQAILEVGLNPDDRKKYRKYSLGMKQRLGIAAALMESPDIIILDEPTNALDDNGIEQILTLIRRERERGALIILSCHDAEILHAISDVIIQISEGRIEGVV